MNQPQRSFDTLQYAKRLQAVGFTDKQAEVQAEAVKDLIDDKLATKADIAQLQADIQRSEEKTRLEIHHLEERINNRLNEVDHRMNEMGYKIIISLGSMIAAGIVILGAIIKLT